MRASRQRRQARRHDRVHVEGRQDAKHGICWTNTVELRRDLGGPGETALAEHDAFRTSRGARGVHQEDIVGGRGFGNRARARLQSGQCLKELVEQNGWAIRLPGRALRQGVGCDHQRGLRMIDDRGALIGVEAGIDGHEHGAPRGARHEQRIEGPVIRANQCHPILRSD